MTSFINMLGNDAWTEADIVNRTEAMIAGAFPRVEILKRKVTGMMLGQYQLTPDEQAEFGAYAALSFQAGQDADAARADMALLAEVMRVEADPALIEGARQEVIDLVALRAQALDALSAGQ